MGKSFAQARLPVNHRNLKTLFVGVVEIHECAHIIAVAEIEFLLALLEPLLRRGVISGWAIQRGLGMRAFFRSGFFYMGADPIANLSVNERIFYYFNHLLVSHPGSLEPHRVKTFPEIRVVIRMQFAGQMQADFIHVTRQVHPAIHDFARTARVNNIAHRRIIQRLADAVNRSGADFRIDFAGRTN